MDEKVPGSGTASEAIQMEKTVPSVEQKTVSEPEHRQAYGTAKTENLRDSGLWRIIIPAAIFVFCLTLFVIPLLILVPLLLNSVDGIVHNNPAEGQLLWIWITMIVLEIFVWAVIVRWGVKTFFTQAGNYAR